MAQSVGSEAKILTKHSFNYGLASVLGQAIGFIMLPVYTRFLIPADYGILELISITTNLLGLVIGIGIQVATSRFYFDHEDIKERNLVISSAFLGYGAIILICTAAMLPFSRFFAKYILSSADYSNLFTIALISLSLELLTQNAYTYFRVTQKSFLMMLATTTRTVMALSLNIYFVVYAKKGVEGILLSSLITNCVYTPILAFYTLKNTGLKVNRKLLYEMMKFGLPLIPSDISMFAVNLSSRYFLKEYSTLTLTGLYALGYKLGVLVNQMVVAPFIQIWNPRRFEHYEKEDSERIHARIFTYFMALSIFTGTGVSVLAKDLIKIMAGEPFWDAYKIVPIIVLAYLISSFHYHFSVALMMKKDTKTISLISISTGVLNLILNFWLIKEYNVWGAAIATLIAFAFKNSLMFYVSNRYKKIIVETKRLIIAFASGFVLYFLCELFETNSVYLNIALKTAACLTYPIILYIARFFTKEEIEAIKSIVRNHNLKFKF